MRPVRRAPGPRFAGHPFTGPGLQAPDVRGRPVHRPGLQATRFTGPRFAGPGLPAPGLQALVCRPPARGGPTIDERLVPAGKLPYIVGPPLAGGLRNRWPMAWRDGLRTDGRRHGGMGCGTGGRWHGGMGCGPMADRMGGWAAAPAADGMGGW